MALSAAPGAERTVAPAAVPPPRRVQSTTPAIAPAPAFSGAGHRLGDDLRGPRGASSQPAPRPIALNDMGVMPGNTRVNHAWMPSKEANAMVRNALPAPAAQSSTQLPQVGGQRGQFVGWKSN
uniref:Uncharacterized protein n=1 Tax=Zooxanthella nutricula TaxID=1333877 RepID=A0A7S2KE47_9DINO